MEINMKIAVIYWTGTGNTEAMAAILADAAAAAGAEVSTFTADAFSAAAVADYDALAFGCPAMGSEELEDSEFRPMWDDVKGSLSGKKTALFGSYDWGVGEWMDLWKEEAGQCGADIIGTVIANNAPDSQAAAELEELGKKLA